MVAERTRSGSWSVWRRLRGCRGQTTVEMARGDGRPSLPWAGGSSRPCPAAADTIYSNFRSAVCKASGKSCSAPPNGGGPRGGAPPASNQDPEVPDDGPSIGGGTSIDTIPGMGNGRGWSTSTRTGRSRFTADQTNSPCTNRRQPGSRRSPSGPRVDFNVGGGAAPRARAPRSRSRPRWANKTSNEVQTDPRTAGAPSSSTSARANPADPRSIPVSAASITMNRESYKGAKGAVAYREIQVEMGYRERPQGQLGRAAPQRLARFRVTVGDSDLVESSVGVSAGPGAFEKCGQTFDDGRARSSTLDVSTPAGLPRTPTSSRPATCRRPATQARRTRRRPSRRPTPRAAGRGRLGNFGLSAGGQNVSYQNVKTTSARRRHQGGRQASSSARADSVDAGPLRFLDGADNIRRQSLGLHVQELAPARLRRTGQRGPHRPQRQGRRAPRLWLDLRPRRTPRRCRTPRSTSSWPPRGDAAAPSATAARPTRCWPTCARTTTAAALVGTGPGDLAGCSARSPARRCPTTSSALPS